MYLTGCADSDKIMVQYLDIETIQNVMIISRTINENLKNIAFIKQLNEFMHAYRSTYDEHIVDWACEKGYIEILEWIENNKYGYKYTESAAFGAIQAGHLSILKWFKRTGNEFFYDGWAIEQCRKNGDIAMLEWLTTNPEYDFTNTHDSRFYGFESVYEADDRYLFFKLKFN